VKFTEADTPFYQNSQATYETPMLAAGSLTRSNCLLLVMQYGSCELALGCSPIPCLGDPWVAPWITVSIPLCVLS